MNHMLFSCYTLVYHQSMPPQSTNARFKDMVHESHESTKSIRQPKWNNHPFKQPIPCFKGCFPFIRRPHSYLMVTTSQIILEKMQDPYN